MQSWTSAGPPAFLVSLDLSEVLSVLPLATLVMAERLHPNVLVKDALVASLAEEGGVASAAYFTDPLVVYGCTGEAPPWRDSGPWADWHRHSLHARPDVAVATAILAGIGRQADFEPEPDFPALIALSAEVLDGPARAELRHVCTQLRRGFGRGSLADLQAADHCLRLAGFLADPRP